MKNFILSAALIATTIVFANTEEKTEATTISKQKRSEIIKKTDKTVYFWEINTATGYASGYTISQAQAKKTVKLMAGNDFVSYKIIEAYK
jgi:exopolysaccharide biosynthesis protein